MKEGNERARHATEQALALEPRSPSAHANLVYLLMDVGDFQGARREIDLADSLSVNGQRRRDFERPRHSGNESQGIGRRRSVVFQTGLAADPLNSLYQINLAGAFWLGGQLTEAEIGFRRTVDLAPQAGSLHGNLALVLWAQHRFEPALAEANLEPAEDSRLVAVAVIQAALGRDAESHEALEVLTRKYAATQPDVLADVYALLGDPDRAFQFLDRMIANNDARIFSIKGDAELMSLHADPRWPALLRRAGLPA